jgi:exopolysaccharide biosynthesis protein
MKRINFSLSLFTLSGCAWISSASAEITATNQPFPGISYYSETRTNPPTHFFVAEVNLADPKIHVRVAPGGPDPDGAGKWQTTLMLPTEVAAREHFDLVVNGDFFVANNVKDAEGKKAGYRAGQFASVVGTAMTDGKTWSVSKGSRPCLVVHKDQTITIETLSQPPADAVDVIGGNTLLVKDGVDVAPPAKTRNPRTVVGLDATGTKMTLLLVDGRKPGIAVGMSYDELAQEMLRLGCRQALNLDGGGSSVMALHDAGTGAMKILNKPTDGRERAVADVLGITVAP